MATDANTMPSTIQTVRMPPLSAAIPSRNDAMHTTAATPSRIVAKRVTLPAICTIVRIVRLTITSISFSASMCLRVLHARLSPWNRLGNRSQCPSPCWGRATPWSSKGQTH